MDETFVYKEVDFIHFEKQFEVQRFTKSDQLQAKQEAGAFQLLFIHVPDQKTVFKMNLF